MNETRSNNKTSDILLIVHLDDSFIRGRLNTISNLTGQNAPNIDTLLKATEYFESPVISKEYKLFTEGMHDLSLLIQKIRRKIITIKLQKIDTRIILLNFTNQKNSKQIYSLISDKILEIENSSSILNKNLEQAKSFVSYLYQEGILPYRSLSVEIVGVYRYACVNNIFNHLSNMIKDDKIPLNVKINFDYTL
jgi:hypothetical protein